MKTTSPARPPVSRSTPRFDAVQAPETTGTDRATLYAFYYFIGSIVLMLLFFIALPFVG